MQHQRCLDVACVDSVGALVLGDQSVGRSEPRPGRRHDKEIMGDPAGAADELSTGELPPWALTMTSLRTPLLATLAPISDSVAASVEKERDKRTRKAKMLVGGADGDKRQEGRGDILGQAGDDRLDETRRDHRIGADRQMRAVLFDRGDRQDGDPAAGFRRSEILARHVLPVALREHLGSGRECGQTLKRALFG